MSVFMVTYLKTKFHFRMILAILIVAVAAGIAASVFLHSLDIVTQLRMKYSFLIYLLPFGGVLTTFLYMKYGGKSSGGARLIIDEIHNPKERIPLRMAPFVFTGSVITHIVGGSAGREGAAVQIAGSLSEKIGQLCQLKDADRRRILIIGISAGFGSALGAPWAGTFFGSEVIHAGKIEKETVVESGIASWFAFLVTRMFKVPHAHYLSANVSTGTFKLFLLAFFSGILFVVIDYLFTTSIHFVEDKIKKLKVHSLLKAFIGGLIILGLYLLIGNFKYAGLGLESIQQSFRETASYADVIWKFVVTNLTLVSGFKGGEFVPLVFIGSHAGSALAHFFPPDLIYLTSLGFCAVFAGASNAPFTSVLMACEFFGWQLFPFALIACYVSVFCSGKKGIY